MNQSNQSKQVLLSVIGVAILVVAVVGVSFAFFNYTRTGAANTIRTGTITFTTDQDTFELNNVFPIASNTVAGDSTNTRAATVTINGSTTYANGIDYTITAEAVDFTVEAVADSDPNDGVDDSMPTVTLPVGVQVTATGLGTVTSGSETAATGNINRIHTTNYENGTLLHSGDVLATGHIGGGTAATGVTNGVVTVKVYLDAKRIAITDTYNGTATPTDEMGTTQTWVNGRTVFTTRQWNSLQEAGAATFKIKVVANETPAA